MILRRSLTTRRRSDHRARRNSAGYTPLVVRPGLAVGNGVGSGAGAGSRRTIVEPAATTREIRVLTNLVEDDEFSAVAVD